jgi:hypothetical protein
VDGDLEVGSLIVVLVMALELVLVSMLLDA